jgi:putative flippase GtrA
MKNNIFKTIQYSSVKEIFIYGLVGIAALTIQDICYIAIIQTNKYMTCTFFLCQYFQTHIAVLAMLIGNIFGMFVSYEGHNKFTFKKEKKCYKEFIKFSITSAIGLCFNLISTYFLINIMHLDHQFGLIPTFIAPAITYSISKFWVFK